MPGPEPVDQLYLDFQTALAGRYSLERELGRGGMGVVYLAREVALERLVAIKVLPPRLAADPALRARFLREARTAAQLSQPNIVPIHTVDETGAFVWFAMAYIDGETLGQRIRARGPLPAEETARILREIAWALAYAHAQGVIHRDLKPDNIILERATGRAVLTDFGIARRVESSGLTAAGELVGTPEFMSPEQASGEALDARSDLYALGVVGFYCLSGRLPFEGTSIPAILVKQASEPAPALGRLATTAPRELCQAIMRCLEKEPGARFADAKTFADSLSLALEQRRDSPALVRVFTRNSLELHSGGCLYVFAVYSSMTVLLAVLARLTGGAPQLWVILPYIVLTLVVIPAAAHLYRIRRLLRAGYGIDDVLLAVRSDMDRKREELAVTWGTGAADPAHARRQGRLGWLLVGLGVVTEVAGVWAGTGLLGFGGGALMLIGLLTLLVNHRRRDVMGERRLRYFGGRLGRWMFKWAARGLPAQLTPAAGAHRPTELAIAFAASDLYQELPKATQAAVAGLPETIQRLEQHARAIRGRIEALEQSIADARQYGTSVAAAEREKLTADLTAARDAARVRLGETVAALETIRLDLLRLRAGAATTDRITADLREANEVSTAVDRLLAGHEAIDDVLRGER